MSKFLTAVVLLCCSYRLAAQTVRTKLPSPSNWSNSAGWSPTGVPNSGEKVIIPAGVLVTVNSSLSFPSLFLDVFGTLELGNNRSLTLNSPSSYINVQGTGSIRASITSNSNSRININGHTQFVSNSTYSTNNGSKGVLNGPAVATGAGPDFQFGILSSSTIVKFEVSRQGQTNLISWETAGAGSILNFLVERSSDSQNWTLIGTLRPGGPIQERFEFRDRPASRGRNYYRVGAVSRDGVTERSQMLNIQSDAEGGSVTVSPNPASTMLRINVPLKTSNEPFNYRLYAASGLSVRSGTIPCNQDWAEIDVSNYRGGTYFLALKSASGERLAIPVQVIH